MNLLEEQRQQYADKCLEVIAIQQRLTDAQQEIERLQHRNTEIHTSLSIATERIIKVEQYMKEHQDKACEEIIHNLKRRLAEVEQERDWFHPWNILEVRKTILEARR